MSKIKIFQISDVHIGMKFEKYPLNKELVVARFDSIKNAITKANKLHTDLFVISGDLFENTRPKKTDKNKVIDILKDFEGEKILILPGNHDYYSSDKKNWTEFLDIEDDRFKLLNSDDVYSFNINQKTINIYPAFCNSKNSKENKLGWISPAKLNPNDYNILIAHGNIKDIAPDINDQYFSMTLEEINHLNMDLNLLGHIHKPYPLSNECKDEKVFYAGTTEPDGMDYKYKGGGWYIKLDSNKNTYAKRIELGKYSFLDKDLSITDEFNKDIIYENLKDIDKENTLIRLNLQGRVSKETYEQVDKIEYDIQKEFIYFDLNKKNLFINLDQNFINEKFAKNSIPYVLFTKLLEDNNQDAINYAAEILMEVDKNDK